MPPYQGPLVLWLPVSDLHVLYPGLGNVHGHGGHSGDEATDHTGSEVALDVVLKVVWGGRGGEGGEGREVLRGDGREST